jgi:hypothetical protein
VWQAMRRCRLPSVLLALFFRRFLGSCADFVTARHENGALFEALFT